VARARAHNLGQRLGFRAQPCAEGSAVFKGRRVVGGGTHMLAAEVCDATQTAVWDDELSRILSEDGS
jgi:hypothetical protein